MGLRPVYAGLYIGSQSLALAVLEKQRGGYGLRAASQIELPADLVQPSPANLNITDPEALHAYLQKLIQPYKGLKTVSLSLPDPAVRVARLSSPAESIQGDDLNRWIRWHMEKLFLSPLGDAKVSSQSIPGTRNGVLAVTIQREILQQYEEAVRKVGVEPIWVTISSFQLFNFYHDLLMQLAGAESRFMVLNLFDHNFTLMIFMEGALDFIRIKGLVPTTDAQMLSDLILHELNTSLSFYSQVQDPSVVTHLFVFGRKMSEFIKKAHDRYHLEVEPLEPERLTFLEGLNKVRPEEMSLVMPALAAAIEQSFRFQKAYRP